MRQWIRAALLITALGFSAQMASATLYLHRTFDQVLHTAEVIVKGTVVASLDTGDHRRSCVVQVDEVLSGTVSVPAIQVNRDYIRMGFHRENYKTSETLVLCLKQPDTTYRPWPAYGSGVPQYEVVGADGEGEFPVVGGEVWVRDIRSEHSEPVRYAGEDLRVRKMAYGQFKQLVRKRQSASSRNHE